MNRNRKSVKQTLHAHRANYTIRRFGDDLLISNESSGFVVSATSAQTELFAVLLDIVDGKTEVLS